MPRNNTLLALISMLFATPAWAASTYSVEAIIFSNPYIVSNQPIVIDEPAANINKPSGESPRIIRAQNKLDNLYARAAEATEIRQATRLDRLESPETAAVNAASPSDTVDTIISFELDRLKEIRASLELSPEYKILQTLSWQQTEADYRHSPLIDTLTPQMKGVIRVYAPNLLYAELNLTYVQNGILPESQIENNIENNSETEGAPVPELDLPNFDTRYYSISGNSDIYFESETEPTLVRYFIDEQRKLKLDEIHYFDHPKFGVILSVKRVEQNKPGA
jgi:hypothetical protein